jgi:hypothetical protein
MENAVVNDPSVSTSICYSSYLTSPHTQVLAFPILESGRRMYGGLFGDLPAAKNPSSALSNDNKEETNGAAQNNGADSDGGGKSKSVSQSTTEGVVIAGTQLKQSSMAASSVVPNSGFPPLRPSSLPGGGRKKAKLDGGISSSSHHFLQTVGKAGTSMAFVPTAALRRSKPDPNSKPPANQGPFKEVETPAIGSATDISRTASSSNVFPASDMGDITTTILRKKPPSSSTMNPPAAEAVNIHGGSDEQDIKDSSTEERDQQEDIDTQMNGASFPDQSQQQHQHTPHPTKAVAEITDPYDPYIPNDLLQYWERQALAQERERLERETREALEKQRLLRERLEKERQELQRSGNYQELIHRQTNTGGGDVGPAGVETPGNAFDEGGMGRGRGRGRGRGISNLPAWLVEKQRLQEQERLGGGENASNGPGESEQKANI